MKPLRIAILTEIAAPFRIPLFNALAEEAGVELRVLFLAERDPKRPYRVYRDEFRFDHAVLPGREVVRRGRWIVWNRGVLREVRRFDPDVVIVGGWNQPSFWQALLWTRLRRRPLVVWIESTERDERPGSPPFEAAKRLLVRAAAGALVPGSASLEYARSLGVPADRIAVAPNAVDDEIFDRRVAEARARRDELRRELGLERTTFLYVGRLDPEKGLDTLLRAVGELVADVVLVGSGSEETALRDAAPPNVRFTGRLDRDGLVPWYAAADAFVLPSRSEQWGMVLNEAAAAALPIVATEAAGGGWDLVEDGVNGFRVPVDDEPALAEALRRVADDAEWRASAGRRSRELGAHFTPEAWAAAVAALARELVG